MRRVRNGFAELAVVLRGRTKINQRAHDDARRAARTGALSGATFAAEWTAMAAVDATKRAKSMFGVLLAARNDQENARKNAKTPTTTRPASE